MHSEPSNKRDVLKLARENNVKYVRLVFADILGVSKTVSIPVERLDAALDGKITFDGGSIDGFVRGEELDMQLRPDPTTFAIFPWTTADGSEARLICEIAMPDGSPFEGCPRTTLRRGLEEIRKAIPSLQTGAEIEFYLFDADRSDVGSTQTADVGSYFDFGANDRAEDARNSIVSGLQAMGIPVGSAHHEHGHGQHELDISPSDPLATADQILTIRTVAKHVAARFGLEATFMPKPIETSAGSGLHLEFNLAAESDVALYAVGGLLAHAPATTAICNSTVNSYKRLVAAWDAPIYTVWSERSANALVRVPPHRNTPVVEMRSPDPSCNPYLAIAVLCAAVADGVATQSLPGDALTGSTYDLSERARRDRGIRTLPKSLRQAIDELDGDEVVRAALGDHIYHAFRDAKLAEYEQYRRAVHEWERRAYLRLY